MHILIILLRFIIYTCRVSFRNVAKGGGQLGRNGGQCENCMLLSYMSIHFLELLTCKGGGIYIRKGANTPHAPSLNETLPVPYLLISSNKLRVLLVIITSIKIIQYSTSVNDRETSNMGTVN